MMMTVRWPLPSGMMVVVGWMIVPLAERSTRGLRRFLGRRVGADVRYRKHRDGSGDDGKGMHNW